jgi:LPXTG-motif cell wall-anchored protein
MRGTIRTASSVLMALLLSVLVAGAALAQDSNYPPGTPADSSVEKSAVSDGDLQRITASGLEAGSDATLTVEVLGVSMTQEVGDDGSTTFEFEIPEGTEDGTYTYEITGTDADGNAAVLAGSFEVDGSLPVTGADLTVGTGLAILALALGATLVLVSRKKTREFEVEAQ